MVRKNFGATLVLLAALGLPCSAPARAETLTIGGTGSALGTMKLLANAFAKDYPGTSVEVLPSLGSGGGIKALSAGAVDLAVSARPLKEQERASGLDAAAYGKSAIVFAVRSSAPRQDLTTEDLVAIFNGARITWPDGTPIRPILRPEVETDTKLVTKHVPGMDAALKAARVRPEVPVLTTDQDAADAIEEIPGALGTATLSLILAERRPLRPLSLNGVAPTVDTIADGSYPMTKTFYVVTRPNASAAVKHFIAFLRSPKGTEILKNHGHVVLSEMAIR